MLNDFNQLNSTNLLVADHWSPYFDKQLRENTLWLGLFQDPNYTIESTKGGDTHKITRVNKPTSSIKTIGTDADSFSSNALSTTQVELALTKRCVSAYKFSDLAIVLSQLESNDSEIREALLADVREQANDFIKGLISPSAATPNHVVSSVADFNTAAISNIRNLAAVAKWKSSGQPYYLFLDPIYYGDLLDDTTQSNANTLNLPGLSPMIEGKFGYRRFGFNIAEDDSMSTDTGFAVLGNGLKVIMGEPTFKISDLHANEQFGYVLSVDFILGGVQMEDTRVISIEN